jgi:hypothetical protein
MKVRSIMLGAAIAMVMAGASVGQQQNTGTQPSPAVLGSPGMQSGGGYPQGDVYNQRGYLRGGRMMSGRYNPAAARNGLTPVRHIPGRNPYGTAARGGGGPGNLHTTGQLIHRN